MTNEKEKEKDQSLHELRAVYAELIAREQQNKKDLHKVRCVENVVIVLTLMSFGALVVMLMQAALGL